MQGALDANGPVFRGVGPILAPQQSAFEQDVAKGERTSKATVGDYVSSAFRQDSPVDGAVAWYVGSQIQPDPNYNPYDPKRLAELTKGINPEFHNELLKARSGNEAEYIRSRLMDKQKDLERLGDLGVGGNIGRFALGLVDPANLAIGVASGGLTSLVRGGLAIRSAAGLASAAGAGYSFERLRQSVNFEDSQTDAVIAGLMGTAFSAPFVGLNAAQMARVRRAGLSELELANAVKAGTPTPAAEQFTQRAEAARSAQEHDTQWLHEASPTPESVERQMKLELGPEPDFVSVDPREQLQASLQKGDAVQREKAPQSDAGTFRLFHGTEKKFPLSEFKDGYFTGLRARAENYAHSSGRVIEADVTIKNPMPWEQSFGKSTQEIAAAGFDGTIQRDGNGNIVRARVVSPEQLREIPAAAHRDLLGETVEWHGNGVEVGDVIAQHGDGTLVVETPEGRRVTIDREDLVDAHMDAPEGFMAGSIGSGQIAPAGVDTTAMSRARFDIYARLNKSDNMEVRQLADLMVKDAIQKSDFYAQDRTASEEKKLLQRRLAGNFHFDAMQAYDAAAQKMGWGVLKRNSHDTQAAFFEAAGRLARGEESVLRMGDNGSIEPELRKAAQAARNVYDTMLEEMKKAGVKGADQVAENPQYVNRIWNVPKMQELMQAVGRDNVIKLVADAIRVPGLTGNVEKAEKFVQAILRLEHSHLSNDILLASKDMKTLRAELKRAKLRDEEIDSIVDTLFEAKAAEGSDAGQASPNLKFRFKIDETQSLDVNGRTVSVADMLENDARILVDRYMNSMAGHVAMAKKGILSRADFEARLRAAEKDHEGAGLARNSQAFAQEMQILDDVYANITGRPMSVHSFNTGDRAAAVLRAMTRSAMLGQLGFTAALELFHAASISTFSAAFKQMPSFANFVRAARKGFVPGDKLAEDIRLMTGFGTEHVSSYARQHEITDFTYDKKLTRLENMSNRMSHAVDRLSGNNFFTSWSRGLAGKFMVQKYADFASGKLKLDEGWRKRLVANGIHSDDIDRTLSALERHTVRDASGRIEEIRWEDWSARDPETYGAFTTAIQREVRNAIQDHDLGETWYFQHTAIGKIFTELRAFSIAAHSKQFLSTLHYRDHQAFHLWITGFVTQALGYVMQTSMNYAHDDEKRQKMLTPDKIAFAAYKRMSVTGIMPLFTEPFLPSHLTGLTANTENRMPWYTPSMLTAGKAVAGASAAVQSLYGERFTGHDVRNALGWMPGANLYGARNIIDALANAAPKTELKPTP